MTNERWRRIEEICHQALERQTDERATFVRSECSGDEALRLEVESLLANASRSKDSELGIGDLGLELIGQQIGVYKVVSLLGAGGMGEVYRARDTKLGRDVAIKVLPPAFVADADRLARFQREARALATLNHPHIGAIYGFEDTAALPALVLELVEGETLAERLAKGPLSIANALKFSQQIAEALDAAHEHGIIHRDLKPANIKITPDGGVKVLDFGLAKDSTPPGVSPPATLEGTRSGMILGTAAYMSPEQARGDHVDKRTDIWAFGCVLFEMLTGRAAFAAATVSDTIARVIEREPEWAALPEQTPAAVRHLLQRCLEKDPRRRLRDIGDTIDDLDPALSSVVASIPERRPFWLPAGVLATVVISALVGWAAWEMKPAPELTVTRFSYHLGEGQRFSSTGRRNIAISPDGTQMAYVADHRLYLKSLSHPEATPVAGDGTLPGLANPVFSPDGRSVAFFSARERMLKRVARGQSAPITICRVTSPFGISWDGDDILFAERGKGILRVSPNGSNPELIVPVDASERAYAPQMLPDGRSVLYTVASPRTENLAESWDKAQVVVQRLGSADRKTLINGGSEARYVPTGHIVYATGGTLNAIRYDVRRAEVVGSPVPLIDGIKRSSNSLFGTAQFSVSNNGSLIYVTGPAVINDARGESPLWMSPGYNPRRRLVWVDRQGREQPIGALPRAYLYPRVSPDGTRVAVDVRDAVRDQYQNIVVWDFARETLTPLIVDAIYPVWTRDGKHIVYGSGRDSPGRFFINLYRQAADGSGDAERLTDRPADQSPHSFTPDSKQLILRQVSGDGASGLGQFDLLLLNLETARQSGEQAQRSAGPKPLLATKFSENNPELSPDGRWLAYESDESGRTEIYVRSFPNVDAARFAVSSGGGSRPLWAPNSRELFYLAGFTPNPVAVMSVAVQSGSMLALGKPRKLFEGPYLAFRTNVTGRTYDVSPDGQRFLMINNQIQDTGTESHAPQSPIFVVLNWFEELKQKVPVRE